jgi:hypothetical protein
MNNSKRPTFNSKTTHPASIPNMPNQNQKREHVTSSSEGKKGGEGKEGGTSTELEIGQSGGAGGGGTGAGSLAGAGNEGDIDDLAASSSSGKGEEGKGIDSSKVHPGSIGSGNGKGKRDSKL